MAEDSWKIHIAYLEDQIKRIDEQASKLESMIPALESEQKKHALREIIERLLDEAGEHRKYLALVKPEATLKTES